MMRRVFLIFLCCFAVLCGGCGSHRTAPQEETSGETTAVSDPAEERELRGVWVATVGNLNYPSRRGLDAGSLAAELDDILSVCLECGLNAVFFQVRPTSDALYHSEIFPTSVFLSGEQGKEADGGFDPLRYLTEKASEKDIDVYAWVNPLRVTYGSKNRPQQDTLSLSEKNPARLHPEWTVAYADGKLYYDAGIPAVRELAADGVAEIAANYPVKGIVFDDYFYPYPVDEEEFDDSASYEAYGNGMDKGDWRRENVNLLVKGCYEAVKKENPNCQFGISPFGIWKNNDGENGGSDTRGLEAYDTIYCDALAWAKGGYVDFLIPQIYWSFDTEAAPFGTVAEWWDKALSGSGVRLYIANAAYKTEQWGTADELSRQIEFSRDLETYGGSTLYSYAALRDNVLSVKQAIAALFSDSEAVDGAMS